MNITIKTPDLKKIVGEMQHIPERVKTERQAATTAIALDMQKAMQEPGQKPSGPIKWDSERQRRAFFATDGFGGGIPHRRTGDYQAGFKIEQLPDGVKFYNESTALPFVGGNAFGLVRSGIHTGRWQLLQPVLQDGFSRLKDAHIRATQNAIQDALS